MRHTAIIECGDCGELTRIELGGAGAILCPKCKSYIQLGDNTGEQWNALIAILAAAVFIKHAHNMSDDGSQVTISRESFNGLIKAVVDAEEEGLEP